MCHLVSDNSFDFVFFHEVKESGRYGDEGTIFGRSSCEGIWFRRFIVAYFGHTDIVCLSNALDGIPDELDFFITLVSILEQDDVIGAFCRPPREKEGDK